jgi:hypothetical protein
MKLTMRTDFSCSSSVAFLIIFLRLSVASKYQYLKRTILAHHVTSFSSINITWTATAKELTESGFRVGLDRIVRDFKYMYLFIVPIVGGMIYLALYAPRGWLISDFAAIVPLANQVGCHALLPVREPTNRTSFNVLLIS